MSKRFERMAQNPKGGWTIADVEAICREFGIQCDPPRGGGSHYKVSHASQFEILTVPSKRPIKAVYVKKLIEFIQAVGLNDGQS